MAAIARLRPVAAPRLPLPSRMDRRITIVSYNVNSIRSTERANVIPELVNELQRAGVNLRNTILLLQDTR